MARTTPVVRGEILTWYVDTYKHQLTVGTPAWYGWLEEASTFAFVGDSGTFTARKESKQHGGIYWRAYRKRHGKLHRAYLGKPTDLTLDRFKAVAAVLAGTHEGDDAHATKEDEVAHWHRQQDTSFVTAPLHRETSRFSGKAASVGSQRGNSVTAPPQHLPAPLTALIGREQEHEAICALLRRSGVRLVTLTGTGGVGKTSLAVEVARAARVDFADGICFVPLAPISDPQRVMPTIAQALGLWEAGDRSLLEQVQDALRDRHLLLLLDNVEQVIEAAPRLSDVLACCPHLSILVTSRAALHLSGEYEFTVPPLAVPDLTHSSTDEDLAQVAAVRLFFERARAIQPGFQLTPVNARTIAEICARLDGLPLAIELAAARIKLLPPQALLKRLSHRLEVLTGGARDLPSRQQTLRNTLQWSYDLLSAQEQRLFRRLSVFVGGCTLEAAAAVAQAIDHADNAGSQQAIEILEEVASLCDKNLLQQTEQAGEEPRLLMLETIREFGLACLHEDGEVEATRQEHAAYYLKLAEEAARYLFSTEAVGWFERLEQEYGNLRAALEWALECANEEAGGGIEIAVRLGSALWRFWTVRGHLSEGRIMLERLLAASEKSGVPVRAKVFLALGTLLWHQGDYARIGEVGEEQLSLCQQLGDQQGVAHTLIGLAGFAAQQSDYARARSLAEESLALCRAQGDTWRTATVLLLLGRLASAQGDHARAQQLLEESQVLYRTLGYSGDIAWSLIYLARNAITQGGHGQAYSWLEEALALCREAGNKPGLAHTLSLLGQEALEKGDVVRARGLLTECHRLNQEVGHRRNIARSLFLLASVCALQGDTAQAHLLYEQSLALAQALGHRRLIASCLEGLAAQQAKQLPASLAKKSLSYPAGLTAREVEVLRLVARGLSDAQVAEQLVISQRTVTTHLTSIYNKLGVNSRTAAAHFAVEHQLV